MIRSPLRLIAALALVALTLFVVACGGNDASDSGTPIRQATAHPPRARRVASSRCSPPPTSTSSIRARRTSPAATRWPTSRRAALLVQAGREEAAPDLAEGDPEISDDKKTVSVTIKKGIKFGPPVDREIQAKDVKYAFERAFTEERPEPVHDVLQLHRGRARSPPGRHGDLGDPGRRERSVQDHVQAHQAAGRRSSPRRS